MRRGLYADSMKKRSGEESAPTQATSRDRVIFEIRNLLLTGELKANQHLVEADLSGRLGVSRTPVREAFRDLVQFGLLVSEPFKGVRIADIDLAQLKQLYEVRTNLEGFAATLFTERMTSEDLELLIRINDEMRQAHRNIACAIALNDEFHRAIGWVNRNQVLIEMIATLRAKLGSFRMVLNYHPGLVMRSVRDHDAIIAAIAERPPETSRQAMMCHILSGITQLPSTG